MILRQIKQDVYNRLCENRPQVLEKNRGYGVISITLNGLTFAVPLRSNLNHPNGFKTIFIKEKKCWSGLDYSKALLIDVDDLEPQAFKLKMEKEYEKLKANEKKIEVEFGAYVQGYIEYINTGEGDDRCYKFTTLQYFHRDLGL
ncbi:hypothetical protein GPY51_16045 [Photorhabdus laumondii subsp. laumondii]|uniref:Photorhabdus luminescens subsp. laumondii TTO1 complete genome segment 17/17 n=2 Tax=Photorhabdus laumondii subsp. laumondii TaxID=141679 RepID=Q7MY23_PHOLL|nr:MULTISPECIES: hypothetical protein [Photorhabdus]AWK44363.1 hypothetical protein A4R40_24220 [Photorhabdus laumondii subsp. laumondii]AXG45089.1 hypothetical protein PluDJC_24500 [Photorhabdus laumondii subsp. laumondii]AXG49675.1 hypothetical protein PluTT01m_25000 [Photorhabdus laumondii subsp. laumondii]KTL62139.1 hypothetical protein AA106_06655 [Photorhabdus laumondii subsp. laumondii]MCC8383381.1 hypothetical protein [Photorhabdus laumondii]